MCLRNVALFIRKHKHPDPQSYFISHFHTLLGAVVTSGYATIRPESRPAQPSRFIIMGLKDHTLDLKAETWAAPYLQPRIELSYAKVHITIRYFSG
jgi:hypothetical protein